MMDSAAVDRLFQQAVACIDDGDVSGLESLLDDHPELAVSRLREPGAWLTGSIGDALGSFFREPYLLWFVAEDPVRRGTLPQNIEAIAQAIVDAIPENEQSARQEQLDHALRLVAWSVVARRSGVQIALIDVLLNAGAATDGNAENALVNGNIDAAEHLVRRGGPISLASALCLGRWGDVEELSERASDTEKAFSLVLAALNGRDQAVRRALALGFDPNRRSDHLYSHGTPLHHAVWSGSLETVTALVEAGADPTVPDSAWNATPLGWAEHWLEQNPADSATPAFADIATYLRTLPAMRDPANPIDIATTGTDPSP